MFIDFDVSPPLLKILPHPPEPPPPSPLPITDPTVV